MISSYRKVSRKPSKPRITVLKATSTSCVGQHLQSRPHETASSETQTCTSSHPAPRLYLISISRSTTWPSSHSLTALRARTRPAKHGSHGFLISSTHHPNASKTLQCPLQDPKSARLEPYGGCFVSQVARNRASESSEEALRALTGTTNQVLARTSLHRVPLHWHHCTSLHDCTSHPRPLFVPFANSSASPFSHLVNPSRYLEFSIPSTSDSN